MAAFCPQTTAEMVPGPRGAEPLAPAANGFGRNISSFHVNTFEQEILDRAAKLKAASLVTPVALDLFCGHSAATGKRLADLGLITYAVDFTPPEKVLLATIGQELPSGGLLHYLQQDLRQFDVSLTGARLDLVVGLRGLHFLRFQEAEALVATLSARMQPGASMYFTVAAIDCQLGSMYKHAHLPVAQRWHPAEPEHGVPQNLTQPICLYNQGDIETLFAKCGGRLRIGLTDFKMFQVEFNKT